MLVRVRDACHDGWAMSLPNDAVANLEALMNIGSDFVNHTSHIAAKDGGPLLDKDTGGLHVAVQRVDGNGSVPDDEFFGSGSRHGSFAHLERSTGLEQPGGLVQVG